MARRAKTLIAAGVLVSAVLGAGRAQAGGFMVVVNNGSPVSTLMTREVSAMFLGKLTQWSNGAKVIPIDQSTGSPVRAVFTRDVHGKTVDAVVNHWQQMIFSGQGAPPRSKPTDEQVLDFVRSNAGAIGYVSAEATIKDVKVVGILP